MFNSKVAAMSMVKCAHSFNHFGLRYSIINDSIVEACCLRCESVKLWDHAIKGSKRIEIKGIYRKKS